MLAKEDMTEFTQLDPATVDFKEMLDVIWVLNLKMGDWARGLSFGVNSKTKVC